MLSRLCIRYCTINPLKFSEKVQTPETSDLLHQVYRPHRYSSSDLRATERESTAAQRWPPQEPQKITPPPSSAFFRIRHSLFGAASCRLYGGKKRTNSPKRRPIVPGMLLSRLRFFSPRCSTCKAANGIGKARRSGENPIDSLGPRPSARSRGTGAADSGLLLPATQALSPSSRGGRHRLPDGTLRLTALSF